MFSAILIKGIYLNCFLFAFWGREREREKEREREFSMTEDRPLVVIKTLPQGNHASDYLRLHFWILFMYAKFNMVTHL